MRGLQVHSTLFLVWLAKIADISYSTPHAALSPLTKMGAQMLPMA